MEGTIQPDSPIIDLVGAISSQAIRDADRVASFLRGIGLLPANGSQPAVPVRLPPELLRGLGHALRSAEWESNHITVHIESDMPDSDELFNKVMALARGPELQALVNDISAKTIKVICQHFVWSAAVELQADVAMIVNDEDAFLDAVAEVIWSCRHNSTSGDN